MGRKTKLASLKVDENIYDRIKLCKKRNELEEDTILGFVNKTLAEKLDQIIYKKLMRRIEKEGLDVFHTNVVRLEKAEAKLEAYVEEKIKPKLEAMEKKKGIFKIIQKVEKLRTKSSKLS